jgi:AcrR family transcriptional regulator
MAVDVKSWRRQQADATKERIADAARRLFASTGYASTSIESIAREAGVGVRTVYAAFGSKREILSGICEAWLERARARETADAVLDRPDARARLTGAAEWLTELYGAGFDVVLILESANDESAETRDLLRAKLAGRDQVMARFIRSVRAELTIPLGEAQAMYRALAAPGVYRELVEVAGWDRTRFAAWLAATLHRELLG